MTILIEGPDGSGKSTLAATLAEVLDVKIVHTHEHGTQENHLELLRRDISLYQTNKILDRSFLISEVVYGNALRRPLFDSRPWFKKLQFFANSNDVLVIFCLPEWEDMHDNIHIIRPNETQSHLDAIEKQEQQIYMGYANLSNACRLFIDCAVVNPFKQTDDIIQMALQHERGVGA